MLTCSFSVNHASFCGGSGGMVRPTLISFIVHFLSVRILRPPFSVSSLDKETLTGAHTAQELIIIQ